MIEYVDATCGEYAYLEGTQYRIAISNEVWDDATSLVLKIQKVYEKTGIKSRRRSSFSLGSDDFEKVNELLKKAKNQRLKGNF